MSVEASATHAPSTDTNDGSITSRIGPRIESSVWSRCFLNVNAVSHFLVASISTFVILLEYKQP